ncbi:hypothetical protein [Paenibacillus gorillae]|uniref:hypothetical protein n=1 Tax=Paenibacillus gorillae TaxID=1243662 RepID=UPI0004B3B36A|nr:hypothetical protein [Paenibacillus gorillae]
MKRKSKAWAATTLALMLALGGGLSVESVYASPAASLSISQGKADDGSAGSNDQTFVDSGSDTEAGGNA